MSIELIAEPHLPGHEMGLTFATRTHARKTSMLSRNHDLCRRLNGVSSRKIPLINPET